MTEYTSLDISRRLAEAGFQREGGEMYWGSGVNLRYRADTLLLWLLSHGDSIEITPDIDGFNCTYWIKHEDYNGINIFLCDALGEVILAVMAKEADKCSEG